MFKQVGDYELKNRIGRGNYADVYLGVHVKTREQYAIKVIAKEKFSHPKLIAGLESEVKIMKEFNHRNILSLKKYFSSANNFYLVMEYCAGGDLNKFIKKVGRLREEHAFNFLAQLAEGIAFLNEQGFIHRDLKTANVLLTEETVRATLKIADFGFARQLQSDALAQTPCGTPLYMAPEVLAAGQYDAKADIWSIGCIFYEMLAGQVPFGGVNETDLLNNIRTKELRAPADVSPVSISILRRLLEKNIPNRASIQDLLQVCQHIHRLSQSQQPSAQAASMLPPTTTAVGGSTAGVAVPGSGTTAAASSTLTTSALTGSDHPAGSGGVGGATAGAVVAPGADTSPTGAIITPAGDGSASAAAAAAAGAVPAPAIPTPEELSADSYSAEMNDPNRSTTSSNRMMNNPSSGAGATFASLHRTPSTGGAPPAPATTPPPANKAQASPPSHHSHSSATTPTVPVPPQPLQLQQPPVTQASGHAYANATNANANAQGQISDSTYDDYEMVDAGASGSSGLRLGGHGPGTSAMSPIPPTPAYQPLPTEPFPANNNGQYPAPINTSYPYAPPQPYAHPSVATYSSPYPPPQPPSYLQPSPHATIAATYPPPPPHPSSLLGPTTVAGLFPAASSSSQDNGDLYGPGQPPPLYPSLSMPTASHSPVVTPSHHNAAVAAAGGHHYAYPVPAAMYPSSSNSNNNNNPLPAMSASQYQQNLQAMAQLVQQQQQQQQQPGYLMPHTASPGTTPPTSTTTASFIQYQDLYQRSMIQRWEVLGHIVHVVAQVADHWIRSEILSYNASHGGNNNSSSTAAAAIATATAASTATGTTTATGARPATVIEHDEENNNDDDDDDLLDNPFAMPATKTTAATAATAATTAATTNTTRGGSGGGAPSPQTTAVWTYAIETPDQLSAMLSALALYLHALALVKTFLVAVELPDDVASTAAATANGGTATGGGGNTAPLSTTPTGTGLLAAAMNNNNNNNANTNNNGGGGNSNPGIDAGWVLLHRLRGEVTSTFLALTQRADQCVFYLQQCTTTSTASASGLSGVGGGGVGGGGATPSVPSTASQAAAWKASLPRAEALMLQEALRQEQDAEMEEMLGHLDRAQHLYEAARHLLVGVSLTFAEDTVDVRKQVQHTLKSLMDALEHKIALCKQRSSVVGRYGLLSESMAVGSSSVGAAGVGEA